MIARGILVLAAWAVGCAAAPGAGPDAATAGPDVRADAVKKIFERSCAGCHDSARLSKPKGGFGHVLDLPRLATEKEFVIPGNPEKSDLYLVLTDPDPDTVMPPPKSDAPKLSDEEKEAVREWIAALPAAVASPSPAAAAARESPAGAAPAATAEPAPEPQPEIRMSALPPVRTLFARMHPMIVHFPISLLILAAVVEWSGFFLRRSRAWVPVVRWSLAVASLAALAGVAAGWLLADLEGFKPATVFRHRWLGVATAGLAWAGWIVFELAEFTGSRALRAVARAIITLGAVAVSLAGHTGGELVYGEGYPFR
jgi:mono/diheme cytochrome c family protein/uncharacterized membrane protein